MTDLEALLGVGGFRRVKGSPYYKSIGISHLYKAEPHVHANTPKQKYSFYVNASCVLVEDHSCLLAKSFHIGKSYELAPEYEMKEVFSVKQIIELFITGKMWF